MRRSVEHESVNYSIVHTTLSSAPEFEAVSYVWRDPERCHNLELVNGAVLQLTRSVAKALPHLTKACDTGYLWIDQITIDQANVIERGHQVGIMGKIYSQSKRVVIWLGTHIVEHWPISWQHREGARWRPRDGNGLRQFLERFWDASPAEQDHTSTDARKSRAGSDPASTVARRARNQFANFVCNEWFTRAWTFQEYVLAKETTFLIGDCQLPGTAVENAFHLCWPRMASWRRALKRNNDDLAGIFSDMYANPALMFFSAFNLSQLYRDGSIGLHRRFMDRRLNIPITEKLTFSDHDSSTFMDLVSTRWANAENTHDYVYSMIGFADFLLWHMRIDYTVPVEEVFAEFAKAIVKECGNVEVLAYVRPLPKGFEDKTPSWAPYWALMTSRGSLLTIGNHFQAAGPGFVVPDLSRCKYQYQQPSDWKELEVVGKELASISQTFSAENLVTLHDTGFGAEGIITLTGLRCFVSDVNEMLGEECTPEQVDQRTKALLRAFFADGVRWHSLYGMSCSNDRFSHDVETGTPHYKIMSDVIDALVANQDWESEQFPYGVTPQMLDELGGLSFGRRLFYSSEGRFGLGPGRAEVGDKIVILHGSRVPFVLRGGAAGTHTLVGECFYDGVMYGESADVVARDADTFTLV